MAQNLFEELNYSLTHTLDWNTFQDKFANFSHFQKNKQYLGNKTTYTDEKTLKNHYENLLAFQKKYLADENQFLIAFQYIPYDDQKLNRLIIDIKKEHFVSLEDLNALINILETHKGLDRIAISIINEFRLICEKDGTDKIESHPKLRKITEQILALESRLRTGVNQIEKAQNFDIIFERFAVMIPSDQYSKTDGSILAHSKTGSILYVEPFHLKKMNEERIELIAERDQILYNLLREIALKLKEITPTLEDALSYLIELDHKIAITRFNLFYELNTPEISANEVHYQGIFHPLIDNPIKNNIEFNNPTNLLISGANTGGKTALLKAIALCSIFMNKGLGTPTKYAKLPLYKDIFFYSQDGQDIQEGLSSFSSEVEFYIKTVEDCSQDSLVIIDEIFNSTSSDEASVLAYSFFKTIAEKDATLYASTHHQNLKELVQEDKNFLNAYMEFDFETLSPNYKIHIGDYDSSHALDIFKRVAKESPYFLKLKDLAYQNLDHKFIAYDEALVELNKLKNEVTSEKEKLKTQNNELQQKLNDIDGSITLKKQKELEKLKAEINNIKAKALKILSQAKTGEYKNKNKLENEFSKITPRDNSPGTSHQDLTKVDAFIIGKTYYLSKMNQNVTLESINGKKARVKAKLGSINCELKDLYKPLKKEQRQTQSLKQTAVIEHNHNEQIEYDCRGMRLDEFEQIVETALSDLTLERIPFLNIIHGHGDGILKKWLIKRVRSDKNFTLSSGAQGNDGMSVIELA